MAWTVSDPTRGDLRAALAGFARGLVPSRERQDALDRVLGTLPAEARAERRQWLGRWSSGCYATHSIQERCDFSCTACYLASTANTTPPAPLEEVRAQLDRIRAHAGPAANVQITSGEVTLLPREELAEIVGYARRIGLDPMVMTNGQRCEREPDYLEHLMREGGLRKIGIHVDATQRGRDGVSPRAGEGELMEVRERMAAVVRRARARTGLPLTAAHTVTVTDENLEDVPAIVRWAADHADVFRMISFLPTASVGRTRARCRDRGGAVWERVQRGLGRPIGPRTFTMGHPSCNRVALLFALWAGGETHVVELARPGRAWDARFFDGLFDGAARGAYFDGLGPAELAGRLARTLAASPRYLLEWPGYAVYRALGERRSIARLARAVLRREPVSVQPLVVVVHDFMSPDELETEQGRARLAACAFRVPVGERLVSMCELNATDLRRETNLAHQRLTWPRRNRTAPTH